MVSDRTAIRDGLTRISDDDRRSSRPARRALPPRERGCDPPRRRGPVAGEWRTACRNLGRGFPQEDFTMAFHISARTSALAALLLAGCTSGSGTGSKVELGTGQGSGGDGSSTSKLVTVTNLTADRSGAAASVLSPLVNAWGMVAFRGSFWVADNGTGKVSILDGNGEPSKGKPASDAIDLGEGITGVAVNPSTSMQIDHDANGNTIPCGPASLIFASEHGQLIGVNTDLSMTGGFVLVDRSDVMAAYTGVATLDLRARGSDGGTGGTGTTPSLGVLTLAADFHNARVDVFDESFKLMTTLSLTDAAVPAGFAPFNVWVWNDVVYVSYAQQNEEKDDAVDGAGLGFVAAFDVTGKVMWTAKGNELNAPWGMALSIDAAALVPSSLIVGNFGDGHITVIDPKTGAISGQLMDESNAPVEIDGLWGLSFGVGVANARPNGLYFAAGPEEEMHGMFGVITPAPTGT
jgi:uncharacterized protein (TIGR03118 family)